MSFFSFRQRPHLPHLPHQPSISAASRAGVVLPFLIFIAFASIIIACLTGSVSLNLSELWQALIELIRGEPASLAASLLELRLGRALTGFITGATLALSGVLMQALLRNPLADPYVLGISGGASVGALAMILFYGTFWMVDMAAFAGAIIVALLLFALAYRDLRGSGSSDGSAPVLLLTGVIVASGCGALITLMLSIAPDSRLRGMVFWMIGDLSNTQGRYMPWIIGVGVLLFAMRNARGINVAAMHADNATTLGVNVGSLLVLADTIARTAVAPQQLPVGVITAIIGVPVFLLQLHQLRRR